MATRNVGRRRSGAFKSGLIKREHAVKKHEKSRSIVRAIAVSKQDHWEPSGVLVEQSHGLTPNEHAAYKDWRRQLTSRTAKFEVKT